MTACRTIRENMIGMVPTAMTSRGVIIGGMLREGTSIEPATSLRAADGGALDPLVGPQCSLAVQLRRSTGAVIGRDAQLDAISRSFMRRPTAWPR